MGALFTSIIAFLLQNVVARFMFTAVSMWMLVGLLPLIAGKIADTFGNPFSLFTPEMWFIFDWAGVDIWFSIVPAALITAFIIRRLPFK
jgi:hypothetical protein